MTASPWSRSERERHRRRWARSLSTPTARNSWQTWARAPASDLTSPCLEAWRLSHRWKQTKSHSTLRSDITTSYARSSARTTSFKPSRKTRFTIDHSLRIKVESSKTNPISTNHSSNHSTRRRSWSNSQSSNPTTSQQRNCSLRETQLRVRWGTTCQTSASTLPSERDAPQFKRKRPKSISRSLMWSTLRTRSSLLSLTLKGNLLSFV